MSEKSEKNYFDKNAFNGFEDFEEQPKLNDEASSNSYTGSAPITKTQSIINHLSSKGVITSWAAIKLYKATRLSAIIYNLIHKKNYNIISEKIEFKTETGHASHYAKYIFVSAPATSAINKKLKEKIENGKS